MRYFEWQGSCEWSQEPSRCRPRDLDPWKQTLLARQHLPLSNSTRFLIWSARLPDLGFALAAMDSKCERFTLVTATSRFVIHAKHFGQMSRGLDARLARPTERLCPRERISIRTCVRSSESMAWFFAALLPHLAGTDQTFFPTPCSRTRMGDLRRRRLPLSIRITHTGFPRFRAASTLSHRCCDWSSFAGRFARYEAHVRSRFIHTDRRNGCPVQWPQKTNKLITRRQVILSSAAGFARDPYGCSIRLWISCVPLERSVVAPSSGRTRGAPKSGHPFRLLVDIGGTLPCGSNEFSTKNLSNHPAPENASSTESSVCTNRSPPSIGQIIQAPERCHQARSKDAVRRPALIAADRWLPGPDRDATESRFEQYDLDLNVAGAPFAEDSVHGALAGERQRRGA